MKKALSLLLVLIMALGCAAFANADESWPTLRVEVYDRTIAGFNLETCMQHEYAQKSFGDANEVNVVFVPVARWSEGDVLTTQTTGHTAPDICITYNGDLVNQLIMDGGVYQLDDLLDEYGPHIKEFIYEGLMAFGRVDADGDGVQEQYFIPARRRDVANVGNFIRKDWLDALEMEVPTNFDELKEFVYAAKEANLGGEITIPFGLTLYKADPLFNIIRFADAFIDYDQITEEDWFAYSSNHEMLPGSKEFYREMNEWYHDGIINENFASDEDATIDSYYVNGYVGVMSLQPDQPWRTDKNYEKELEANVEGASWIPFNPFVNMYGDTLHDIYAANGLTIFIPGWVSEETAINAIKYLDWMCEPDNMFYMQNGELGYNYLAVNEDGIPIEVQSTDVVPDEYKMHATDVCFIANGLFYGTDEKTAAGIALPFTGYEELVKQSYVYAQTDAWTQVSFTVPLQSETDYKSMVQSKQGEFLVNVLTCNPDDFDAVYDEYIEAILAVGADKIIEEHLEAYNAGNYRGTYPYAE